MSGCPARFQFGPCVEYCQRDQGHPGDHHWGSAVLEQYRRSLTLANERADEERFVRAVQLAVNEAVRGKETSRHPADDINC